LASKLFAKSLFWPRRWRAWLAGAIAFVLLLLLFPFQTTTAPRWQVKIVDESGAVIPGINVTEHWQHYLLEAAGHEEVQQTDQRGLVDFPARTVRAGMVNRAVAFAAKLWQEGAKAKLGPYAALVVWGSSEHEIAVANLQPGKPPQADIVVHRK
jgi:hypothetical protein